MSVLRASGTAGGKKSTVTESSTDTESDAEERLKAEAAWERIRKSIPDSPFILTVPQDAPAQYHHYSRQDAESWMMGNLFEPDEERMQYTTFQYREYGQTCFVCRSEVDEERDRQERLKQRNPGLDKKTLLQGSGSGKKVKLGAYLNKKAAVTNGTSTAQTKQSASERDPVSERTKPMPANHASQVNGVKSEVKDLAKDTGSSPLQKQKRYHEDTLEVKAPNHSSNSKTAPPTKRPKRSPPPEPRKRPVDTSVPMDANPHDLPPLLSPILPATKYDLPPLLSPTLPANIQAELDKLASKQRARAVSDASTSSDKKPHPQIASKSPAVKPKDTPLSSSKPLDVSTVSSEPKHSTTAGKGLPNPKKQYIVKLRYGRKHRKEVERYLKLPQSSANAPSESKKARPSAGFSTKDREKTVERIKKVEATSKSSPASAKNALRPETAQVSAVEKRPREEDPPPAAAPALKRHKANASVDLDSKPRTPAQATAASPALSNRSSAQKNQYLTPVKENKAISMVRGASDQGNTTTPGRSSLTPASAKTSDAKLGPTSAPPGKRVEERIAWSNLSRQLNQLGRNMKHQCQDLARQIAQNHGGKDVSEDKKRCAILGLECILAYMAAYACMDYSSKAQHQMVDVDRTWRTLLPLWDEFKRHCKDVPHLEGLRLHLGAIVQSRISFVVAQRANGGGKVEQAPTPGSNATDTNNEASLELLSKSFTRLVNTSAFANQLLPLSDVMEQYPETWAKQAGRNVDTREYENLTPGDLKKNGPFKLPLGVETSPVMGVRFGLTFLREWIKKDGVKHELQVRL